MITQLLEAAAEQFGTLEKSETAFLTGALGNVKKIGDQNGGAGESDARYHGPSQLRKVRAPLLRWLFSHPESRERVEIRGTLALTRLQVIGRVNFSFLNMPWPVWFVNCQIPDGLDMSWASAAHVAFLNTSMRDVSASGITIGADLHFGEGVTVDHGISLPGARIGGNLNCIDARFGSGSIAAVDISGAKVSGGVRIVRTKLTGPLRMVGVELGRDLSIKGTEIIAARGGGLTCTSAKIHGNVFFREGSVIQGSVLLIGSRIDGDLSCTNSVLTTDTYGSIDLSRVTLGGAVSFADCRITGAISFVRADIGRDLAIARCAIVPSNGKQSSVRAYRVRVGGSVRFDGVEAVGRIDFAGASIEADLDARGLVIVRSDLSIARLQAQQINVGGSVLVGRGFTCAGLVNLNNCRIRGNVDFRRAHFQGESDSGLTMVNGVVDGQLIWTDVEITPTTVLFLSYCRLGFFSDSEQSWPQQGKLRVSGLRYDGISANIAIDKRIAWLSLQQTFRSQPYRELSRILRAHGSEIDARKVLLAEEEARYNRTDLDYLARLWHRFLKYTVGFGYLPRRALYWLVTLITVGTIVFSVADRNRWMAPLASTGVGREQITPSSPPTEFRPLIYSIDNALPFIQLGQKLRWYPSVTAKCQLFRRSIKCGTPLEAFLWLHIAAGWILTTIGVAGVTGFIRRT